MPSKILRRAAEVSTLLVFLSVSALSQTGQMSNPKQSSGAPSVSATDKANFQASFDDAVAHYNKGIELIKTGNWQGSLSEFDAAKRIAFKHKDEHEAFAEVAYKSSANLAEAHYQLGAGLFNNKKPNEAKVHFEQAVESIDLALAIVSTVEPEKNPNLKNDLNTYDGIRAKNMKLLIMYFSAIHLIDDLMKMIDKDATIGSSYVASVNSFVNTGIAIKSGDGIIIRASGVVRFGSLRVKAALKVFASIQNITTSRG